ARLGFQNDANSADVGQPAVSSGSGQHGGVVQTRDSAGEDVGFKSGSVEQVVLKEFTRLVGFSKGLNRQEGVRSPGHAQQAILQWRRHVLYVSAAGDGRRILRRVGIRVAGGWWLVRECRAQT